MTDTYQNWTEMKSHCKGIAKVQNQDCGSDDRNENDSVVCRRTDKNDLKVMIRFEDGHDIRKVGLVAISYYLPGNTGEIEKVNVLSDGSLLS